MTTEYGEKIATRAIIVVEGKVLLGKKARGVGEGKYALAGGKPDGGETPEQTIVREVKEETGLTFKDPILWKEIVDEESVPGETWHTFYFLGETEGVLNLKKDEILEVIYVGRRDLSSVDIAFNHREILTQFFEKV